MRTALATAAILAAAGCSVPEGEHHTMYGARVYALDGNEFEVVPPNGAPGDDYWCAASDYARRALGAGWQQEMYVSRGRGPGPVSGRNWAVLFTLDPVPQTEPAGWISRVNRFKPGDSMSVQRGDSFCRKFPRDI